MKWEMISVFTVILILLSGCIFQSSALSVEVVSITPDKAAYHSKEQMIVDVIVNASDTLENVTINATGLENRQGTLLLRKSNVTDLNEGINNITFYYTMPTCSSCKGLKAGIYLINVTVVYNGKMLANGTKSIELMG